MLRFSLLTLVGLITLVPIELFSLKNPVQTSQSVISYVVYIFVLTSTWGAFCLKNGVGQFCKGVATLAWANILYAIFVREEVFITAQTSPLAKLLAELLEHPMPANQSSFNPSDSLDQSWIFFKIWNYWSILNSGLLGGFLAIRIPFMSAGTVRQSESSVGKLEAQLESALLKQPNEADKVSSS